MNSKVDHSDAKQKLNILKIAVPIPLFGSFDYLVPESLQPQHITAGCRVEVPFGRRTLIGVVLEQTDHSDFALNKLKTINKLIDTEAVLDASILELLRWASTYYLHPIGEVVQAALPSLLRQGKAAEAAVIKVWMISDETSSDSLETLNRAAKQKHILQILLNNPEGLGDAYLNDNHPNWRPAMKALVEKGLVICQEQASLPEAHPISTQAPTLNDEQTQAIAAISEDLEQHHIHLLHGVTGSGKTEVYLALSERVIASGKQVLVLVPEISLTPQLTERFQQRMGCPICVLHSGLNDQQRLSAWHAASTGHARLVIGTRSAIFTPLPTLGLILVDEEHDGSYKQQEGFRYNARDLALVRSQKANIPVVLGSATPSLESLYKVNQQRFHLHTLKKRARAQTRTQIKLLDMCSQPVKEGLSAALLDKVDQHLKLGNQVILFLNRRGFSPLLMCHDCGWMTRCQRCDANMTYHKHKNQLHCHHCGAESRSPTSCGDCGSEELLAIGTGTERIEEFLTERFPEVHINRIDRDTTRRKGALEDKLQQAHAGGASILVGTQMLAKGHDFPNVTLVGVLDTDQALYSADFRAAEHLAQLIIQVSGRAGRAEKPGEVLIQTHHPDHPLLQTLLHHGYEKFAESALIERKQAGFPPYKHLVLLRCGAIKKELGMQFMNQARELANHYQTKAVEIYGPWPAPMEKRAGRFRTQTMLQANDRKALHQLLRQWLPQLQQLKIAKQVRWSIDVDPYDTF